MGGPAVRGHYTDANDGPSGGGTPVAFLAGGIKGCFTAALYRQNYSILPHLL